MATNMEQTNSSINATLLQQIESNIFETRQKVYTIAEEIGVNTAHVDAILQDYEAVLMDKYTFLYMTPQMYDDFITTSGNLPTKWQPLTADNKALSVLFTEYKRIGIAIYNIKQKYTDIENATEDELQQYVEAEITEDMTAWQVARNEVYNYFGRCVIDAHDTAVIYKHIMCLIALRRQFITSDNDLLPLKPVNCAPLLAEKLQQYNKAIIKQTDDTMPKAAEHRKKRASGERAIRVPKVLDELLPCAPPKHPTMRDESATPQPKEKTVFVHQNFLETLNTEIDTSWRNEKGVMAQWLPLRNTLNVGGLTPTTLTYAEQAFKAFGILPFIAAKTTEEADFVTYHLTLAAYTQVATGTPNSAKINNEQIRNMYYALKFWSERFIRMTGWSMEYKVTKKKDIKYTDKWKPFQIELQPIRVIFKREGAIIEADGSVSGQTQIDIGIHKAIVYGRSERTEIQKKNKIIVRQPCKYFLKLSQYQLFNTPEGINFQRIIMYCNKRTEYKSWNEDKENDILADIFGYRTRLKGKTGEELKKEKQNIKAHKPRDKKMLEDFFVKAKEGGFITEYSKTPATNGIDYVWTWKRNITTDLTEDTQPLLTAAAEA